MGTRRRRGDTWEERVHVRGEGDTWEKGMWEEGDTQEGDTQEEGTWEEGDTWGEGHTGGGGMWEEGVYMGGHAGSRSYLHPGADDIHGIGEDGRGGRGQRPRDGLEDDVRTLLRAQVRELL